MDYEKIRRTRSEIDDADIVNALAFLLENGSTAHDGLMRLTQAQREMIVSALCVYGETRARSVNRAPVTLNFRKVRVERKWSLALACKEINQRARDLNIEHHMTPDRLCSLEERAVTRDALNPAVVRVIESVYERGWEFLATRIDEA